MVPILKVGTLRVRSQELGGKTFIAMFVSVAHGVSCKNPNFRLETTDGHNGSQIKPDSSLGF
jgi:hypothetical protein